MAQARAVLRINDGEVQAVLQDSATQVLARTARKVVAQAKLNAPVDTGNMRAQIAADPIVISGTRMKQTIRVGGNAAEYSIYVHEGTRPHVIRPRNAKVLAFNGSEGRVFTREVHHPGTHARPFLRNAVQAVAPSMGFTVTGT